MRIIPYSSPGALRDIPIVKTLLLVLGFTALLTFLGPVLLYPDALMLLPALLLTVLVGAGLPAFALCAAACALYAFLAGGWLLGLCLLVATVPAMVVGGMFLAQEKPFVSALAAGFLALFGGLLLASLLAMALTEGQLVARLTARLETLLHKSAHTDTLLLYGYVSGLLPLTPTITVPALTLPASADFAGSVAFMGSRVVLNPAAHEELLRALLFRFETSYTRALPTQLVSAPLLGAVLLQLLPRAAIRRHGVNAELPGLRKWFIPAGRGRYLLIPVGVAWLIAQLTVGDIFGSAYVNASGAFILFSALYHTCQRIFALQGMALLDSALYRRGFSRAKRIALLLLAYVLLGSLLALLGMLDQGYDLRHLRRPPEEDHFNDHKQEDDF